MNKKEMKAIIKDAGKKRADEYRVYKKQVNEILDSLLELLTPENYDKIRDTIQYKTKVESDGTHVHVSFDSHKPKKFIIAPDMTDELEKLSKIQWKLWDSMFNFNTHAFENISIVSMPSIEADEVFAIEDPREKITEIIESWGEYTEEGKKKIPELVDKILEVLPNN